MPVYEQPMRKLLGTLSPTIAWLKEQGSVDVSSVPDDHLDAIKQLERIGIVHKRNNRSYELQTASPVQSQPLAVHWRPSNSSPRPGSPHCHCPELQQVLHHLRHVGVVVDE